MFVIIIANDDDIKLKSNPQELEVLNKPFKMKIIL